MKGRGKGRGCFPILAARRVAAVLAARRVAAVIPLVCFCAAMALGIEMPYSWECVGPSGVPSTDTVLALTVAPSGPSTVYAFVEGEGVLYSSNSGDAWAPMPDDWRFPEYGVADLDVDPEDHSAVFALVKTGCG